MRINQAEYLCFASKEYQEIHLLLSPFPPVLTLLYTLDLRNLPAILSRDQIGGQGMAELPPTEKQISGLGGNRLRELNAVFSSCRSKSKQRSSQGGESLILGGILYRMEQIMDWYIDISHHKKPLTFRFKMFLVLAFPYFLSLVNQSFI